MADGQSSSISAGNLFNPPNPTDHPLSESYLNPLLTRFLHESTTSLAKSPDPGLRAVLSHMYNQGHQQTHGARLNGNSGRQGMPNPAAMFLGFQGQGVSHQQHQGHAQHQQNMHADHASQHPNTMSHHGGYSSGVMSNASPFTNGLQNGHGTNRASQPTPHNEHWQEQIRRHDDAKQANEMMSSTNQANYYARLKANENKGISGPLPASLTASTTADGETEDLRRPMAIEKPEKRQDWHNLDLSGQGLKALSPALFQYDFLRELYIASNKLTTLPAAIGQLRQLHLLEASYNDIVELPIELGMCTFLKELMLFNNQIRTLPDQLGSLHLLEHLGIEGNPLNAELKNEIKEKGTKSLISLLRERSGGK